MYEAMILGLYHRFKLDEEEEKDEKPLDFERFVAEVMVRYFGGSARVTGGSGDYGVDIEYKTPAGDLLLGQVKCYAPWNKVSFDPIAIIHSQMVKQGAKFFRDGKVW